MLEWIDIPAGEVKIEGKPYHVDAFQIAKYPVTVHQFEYFVNYNEYKIRENWTTAGLEWRNENGIALPEFWNNSEWHISTHPVVGVSWYEALAFCWWLREKIHLKVTLPTEEQWQRAAQGDDGRKFPWGMGFDNNRANTEESGIRKTTPVDKYSAGASPFGVMDMSGNVYEWCLNQWDDIESGSPSIVGNARRSVRGGNWSYPQAGTMDRESRSPIARKPGLGFRVCRSLT
jgi:formylglycine-generating enzyme required for sulfatase activity